MKRYLVIAVALMTILMAIVLVINVLVDPLFFFGGNKVSGRGYYLNERVSVIAVNRHRWPRVDCLIFGTSRMTFLDASKIKGYNCANMAISGGHLNEYIVYEKYLKTLGVKPRLVIVGTDNYLSPLSLSDVPDFILKDKPLPSWLHYYSSADTLVYSLEALAGLTMSPNYYDQDMRKHIGFPMRRPGKTHFGDLFYVFPGDEHYVTARIPFYRQFCNVFPKARCIGFSPPVSTWGLENGLKQGMEPYLKSMEKLSRVFDSFYDFSILPKPQWDFTETSDGIHFSARIWDTIATELPDLKPDNWGLDVKRLPAPVYEQDYISSATAAVAARKTQTRDLASAMPVR